jgi:polyisoprenoid-binding protein YceI
LAGAVAAVVAKTQRWHAGVLGDSELASRHVGFMTNTITRWTLDPGHSAVGFSVRHLMITTVRGEFGSYRAAVTYDPARPEATRLDATIDVASLDTREAKRDGDLRSPLFFDADNHPTMTFVSKAARAIGQGELEVTGELTIRGITKAVALTIREISDAQTDMRGSKRIGATATARIKRSDFGMTWNKALDSGGVVVGDVVTISIEASLVATPES